MRPVVVNIKAGGAWAWPPFVATTRFSGSGSSFMQAFSSMLVHLPLVPAWLCFRCWRKWSARKNFFALLHSPTASNPARGIRELLATVATHVSAAASHRGVECCFWAGERSAGPRMTSQMKGVLVAFCFVLVLEAVGTISTTVLLFGLVQPGGRLAYMHPKIQSAGRLKLT